LLLQVAAGHMAIIDLLSMAAVAMVIFVGLQAFWRSNVSEVTLM
jgi:hypothetical protein